MKVVTITFKEVTYMKKIYIFILAISLTANCFILDFDLPEKSDTDYELAGEEDTDPCPLSIKEV